MLSKNFAAKQKLFSCALSITCTTLDTVEASYTFQQPREEASATLGYIFSEGAQSGCHLHLLSEILYPGCQRHSRGLNPLTLHFSYVSYTPN